MQGHQMQFRTPRRGQYVLQKKRMREKEETKEIRGIVWVGCGLDEQCQYQNPTKQKSEAWTVQRQWSPLY